VQLSDDRRNELYLAALQGGSPSGLLLRHMDLHQLTFDEAAEDWEAVMQRLRVDASMTSEMELARVRACRWQIVSEASRRGQYLAASGTLKDLGFAAGEQQASLLSVVAGAPVLRIVVEGSQGGQEGGGTSLSGARAIKGTPEPPEGPEQAAAG
jgi:hypothetical protein